jgi:protein-disulfide isomerase-like protein with CxxC motif
VTRSFAITFDYLCPFARNANEHVIEAMRGGAGWDVTFVPYSLAQGHVAEGETDVWDLEAPDRASGILALQVGIAVRDRAPDRFLDVHEALFAARHDQGGDIKDPAVLRDALSSVDVDPDEVFGWLEDGTVRKLLQAEHEAAVRDHQVWGVPTFITDTRAVFVRVMDRPGGDAVAATQRIEHIVDLVDGPVELHEFKQVDLTM